MPDCEVVTRVPSEPAFRGDYKEAPAGMPIRTFRAAQD